MNEIENTAPIAKKRRESCIELLKILAIFLIVISHAAQTLGEGHPGINVPFEAFIDISSASKEPAVIFITCLRTMGIIGNLIFLVCSAWFLSKNQKLSVSKIMRMILDVWLISIIYLITFSAMKINLNKDEIIASLFPILFSTNWFITCYLILYCIHPFLNWIIERANAKGALLFSIISLTMYFVIGYYFDGVYFMNNLVLFVIVYFIVGFLRKFGQKITENTKLNILFVVLGLFLYLGLTILYEHLGVKYEYFKHSILKWNMNQSFPALLLAIGLFNLFKKIHFTSRFINYISSLTLFIYVIHENLLLRTYIRPLYYGWIYNNYGYQSIILWVLLFALIMFIGSIVISALFDQTFGKITRLISEKTEMLITTKKLSSGGE